MRFTKTQNCALGLHGEETVQSEPSASLMKSCVGLSGHVRLRIISAEITERTT